MHIFETDRLILREWQKEDLLAFAAMNQDPKVLEFLPAPLSTQETAAWMERINQHFMQHGYGFWAVTLKSVEDFIGYVGLNVPAFETHFTPCVEVGWRLASAYWGKGYATEAAKMALKIGFETFHLPEIVSFTVPANQRSIHVMQKAGLHRDPLGNFHHPKLPKEHPLSLHVLYTKRSTIDQAHYE